MKLSTKLICSKCNNLTVEYEDYCGGTSYYRCKTCNHWGSKDEFSEATLFDTITVSPEVLARSLCGNVRVGCFSGYYSMLTGMYYPDMEKAYIATLEKLKEV